MCIRDSSYGDAIPAQEKPTREGYTFVSWDKNVPDTVSDENVKNGKLVFKAVWKEIAYTLSLIHILYIP